MSGESYVTFPVIEVPELPKVSEISVPSGFSILKIGELSLAYRDHLRDISTIINDRQVEMVLNFLTKVAVTDFYLSIVGTTIGSILESTIRRTT